MFNDTFFLHQNPPTTTFKGYIDNLNPIEPTQIWFWFAENNYVGVNALRSEKQKFVVFDPQGRFQTKIVEAILAPNYPLCTSASQWDDPPESRSFVKGYRPYVILLELKN
ncbi:MAG: hypothetical protein GC180_05325 [Bacteroidetes bacterium]|nr:hypothetical protein [Bacteroidota bacterium]